MTGRKRTRAPTSASATPETPTAEAIHRARELYGLHLARDLIVRALVLEHALTESVAGQAVDLAVAAVRAELATVGATSKDEKRARVRETLARLLRDSVEARDRKAALKATEILARIDGVLDDDGKGDNRTLGDLVALLRFQAKDPTT